MILVKASTLGKNGVEGLEFRFRSLGSKMSAIGIETPKGEGPFAFLSLKRLLSSPGGFFSGCLEPFAGLMENQHRFLECYFPILGRTGVCPLIFHNSHAG